MTAPFAAGSDEAELAPGTVLADGALVVEMVLGRGGASTVYRVKQQGDGTAALKVLAQRYAGDFDMQARLRNEYEIGRALAELPFVVRPLAMGQLPELSMRPFMLQPYVDGTTLSARIMGSAQPVGWSCRIARRIADALVRLHARGVIHRDIKPGNVLVGIMPASTDFHLLDFGYAYSTGAGGVPATAGLTQAHQRPGTPHYMAPEQVLGRPPTEQFDVYALGVTLYEMLLGDPPMFGLSRTEVMRRKCDPSWPTPSIGTKRSLPASLVRLLDSALEREPEARMKSAADFRSGLDAVIAEIDGAEIAAFNEAGDHASIVPLALVERAHREMVASGRDMSSSPANETVDPLPPPTPIEVPPRADTPSGGPRLSTEELESRARAEKMKQRAEEDAVRREHMRVATVVVRDKTELVPADHVPKPPPVMLAPEVVERAPEPAVSVGVMDDRDVAPPRRAATATVRATPGPSPEAKSSRAGILVVATLLGVGVLGIAAWLLTDRDHERVDVAPAPSVGVDPPSLPSPQNRQLPDPARPTVGVESPRLDSPEREPPPADTKLLTSPSKAEPNRAPRAAEAPPVPAHATERCERVRGDVDDALAARSWSRVLELTRGGSCWANQQPRKIAKVQALAGLGQYDACAAEGAKLSNVARIADIVEYCKAKMGDR